MSSAAAATSPRRESAANGPAFLNKVIETMVHTRIERDRALFVIAAPEHRAGTSYVANLLALGLAGQTGHTVGLVDAAVLKECSPRHLPHCYVQRSPDVWAAVPDKELEYLPDFALEQIRVVSDPNDFDFILVDCPPLTVRSPSLRWTAAADGVLLVVEAGVTPIQLIEESQRLLMASSSHLAGIILNRRTYPIPRMFYQFL